MRPYTSHFSLPKALLVPLFVGAAAALAWQAWVVGVTYDEPYHLVTGYLYWQGRQGMDAAETTPPLIYITVGWIPHLFGLSVPSDPAEWVRADSWTIGRRALQSLESPRARRLIFFSRLPLGYFFEPEYRDYFRYFREREPEAKAGYSIFIYRVPGGEHRGAPVASASYPIPSYRLTSYLLPPLLATWGAAGSAWRAPPRRCRPRRLW